MTKRYQREQALLLSIIHGYGMPIVRNQLGKSSQTGRPEPSSWLGQQRKNVSLLILTRNVSTNAWHAAVTDTKTVTTDFIVVGLGHSSDYFDAYASSSSYPPSSFRCLAYPHYIATSISSPFREKLTIVSMCILYTLRKYYALHRSQSPHEP